MLLNIIYFQAAQDSAVVRASAHMPEVPGSIPGGGHFQQKMKFLFFVEDTKLSGNFTNFCNPSGRQIVEDFSMH